MKHAYDPTEFRRLGHELVDGLAAYLESALAGDMPVLPSTSPQELERELDAAFPAEPTGDLVDSLLSVVERANHLHHPRYVGHQVPPAMPQAALAELARTLLNGSTSIFEMGPAATIMERHVVRFLARRIGYGPDADGALTHGGSVGNLTALLAVRQLRAGTDVWQEGPGEARFTVLASEEGHYSVRRSVQIMGWGADGVTVVPVDEHHRMDPRELAAARARAEARGRRVLAVVANACSTATGAFDPLEPIADFCGEHDLWLHVDGAHGASFLLSRTHRQLLAGIERADSVVWDLHKMLLLPSLVTAVLFREGGHGFAAFHQDASYVFRRAAREERYDMGLRTIECTKGAVGMTAYAGLRACGTAALERYLDGTVELARSFADLVERADDFELAVRPTCNIVCFRRLSAEHDDLDALQERLRARIVGSGKYYLVLADLRGARYLRMTLIHPFTRLADLEELLEELRRIDGP